jgi:hypothetical protein
MHPDETYAESEKEALSPAVFIGFVFERYTKTK